jgi:hypothetical protein
MAGDELVCRTHMMGRKVQDARSAPPILLAMGIARNTRTPSVSHDAKHRFSRREDALGREFSPRRDSSSMRPSVSSPFVETSPTPSVPSKVALPLEIR